QYNITLCVMNVYRYHGGQLNNRGLPTGKGYNPKMCGGRLCPPPAKSTRKPASAIRISQHVWVASNNPQAHALQVAWQAINHKYAHDDEFTKWYLLCADFYRDACSSQLRDEFDGGVPFNTQTEDK